MREVGQLRIEEHAAEAVDGRHDERVEASGVVTDGRDTVGEPSPDDARPEPPDEAHRESEPADAPRPALPTQRRRPG